eukprot:7386871-Karenia_brevis.AAC.1
MQLSALVNAVGPWATAGHSLDVTAEAKICSKDSSFQAMVTQRASAQPACIASASNERARE